MTDAPQPTAGGTAGPRSVCDAQTSKSRRAWLRRWMVCGLAILLAQSAATAYPATFVIGAGQRVKWAKVSSSHSGRTTAEEFLRAIRSL